MTDAKKISPAVTGADGLPSERILGLLDASTLDELALATQGIAAQLGYSAFFYFLVPSAAGPASGEIVAKGSYPAGWIDSYIGMGLYADDPSIVHARTHRTPFLWDELSPASGAASAVGALCLAHSVEPRVSIPLHEPGAIFTFHLARGMGSVPDMGQALLLARCFHARNQLLHALAYAGSAGVELTPREVECLRCSALGMKDPEIAALLGISIRTVVFHMANTRTKLAAKTRQLAIAKAMRMGLL